jgi:hypothetical protein
VSRPGLNTAQVLKAMTELGDPLRFELTGGSRADAIKALFTALPSYIAEPPGRP